MTLTEILSWVINNWDTILAIVSALIGLATAITKLTPTKKDDAILRKVVKVTSWLSVLHPKGVSGLKIPMTPGKEKEEIVEENLP